MNVIQRTRLEEFWNMHAKAEKPLLHWYDITRKAQWKNFQQVRQFFPHADPVRVASNRPVVVFNIGGNDYRLIAAIHYNTHTVYVLGIMSHAEYSKGEWKKIL